MVIDPVAGHVLRPDGVRRLSSRAGATLAVLAEHAGQVVSRESLIARAWADGTGSDDAVVRTVSELRSTLGDRGREHRYIATVPGQGYRLLATPQALTDSDRQRLTEAAKASRREPPQSNILLSGTRQQRTLKVLSLYAAAVWLAMQVADLVFPRLGLPDIGVNYVIALGVLGFPLIAAFAWFYRPPPEGAAVKLQRTALALILIATVGTLAYFIAKAFDLSAPPVVAERSIAVLPFDNMSGDSTSDYLGDGLAEEITTLLTSLPHVGLHLPRRQAGHREHRPGARRALRARGQHPPAGR
jgi:DNA-binding winged helix-turn-helix (wHTH) protein